MTICASVKVRDGLVIGTDSMTQIQGTDNQGNTIGVIKTYSNARKLFQIKDWPIGIMTYGLGNIGQRSMQGLVAEFGDEYEDLQEVKTVAKHLLDFIQTKYIELYKGKKDKPALGFFIAGYSPGEHFSEEWEFLLPRDSDIKSVRPADNFGASWRGIDIPFIRLYKGFDPRMMPELQKKGASKEILDFISSRWELSVVYDGMPVQDGVNFVTFILNTTIGMTSFEPGPDPCGGPLQVATILPRIGFKWISEPMLSVQ